LGFSRHQENLARIFFLLLSITYSSSSLSFSSFLIFKAAEKFSPRHKPYSFFIILLFFFFISFSSFSFSSCSSSIIPLLSVVENKKLAWLLSTSREIQ
jgi:hypothetical protein